MEEERSAAGPPGGEGSLAVCERLSAAAPAGTLGGAVMCARAEGIRELADCLVFFFCICISNSW